MITRASQGLDGPEGESCSLVMRTAGLEPVIRTELNQLHRLGLSESRRLLVPYLERGLPTVLLTSSAAALTAPDIVADAITVLVDLPALESPSMVNGGDLHEWIAGHHGIHRHLLVPLDLDPAEDTDATPDKAGWALPQILGSSISTAEIRAPAERHAAMTWAQRRVTHH